MEKSNNFVEIQIRVFVLLAIMKLFNLIECSHVQHDSDSEEIGPRIGFANLESAVNKTSCPFEVTRNINATRWPVEIKEITCSEKLRHACCDHHYECTQLVDRVMVYTKDRKSHWMQHINVGCVCLRKRHSKVIQPEKPPVTK